MKYFFSVYCEIADGLGVYNLAQEKIEKEASKSN